MAREYEGIFDEYKRLLKEQKKALDQEKLQSDEEIRAIQKKYAEEKLALNKNSVKIKENISTQQKAINGFKRQHKKLEKDITTAEALGLSTDEYLTIVSTLKNQEILKRILEEKGLAELVSKKKSELTKEEKQELKEAHNRIIEEISMYKSNDSTISIVDAIQALYNIEDLYIDNSSKTIKMRKKDISTLIENTKGLPEKIRPAKQKKTNYIPQEAPIDMKVKDEEKVERKPIQYVINLPKRKTVDDVLSDLFQGITTVNDFSFKDVKADDSFISELHGDSNSNGVDYNVVTKISGKVETFSEDLKRILASNMKSELINVQALIKIYDRLDGLAPDSIDLLYREYNAKKLNSTPVALITTLKNETDKAIIRSCHAYNTNRMTNTLYSTINRGENENIRVI